MEKHRTRSRKNPIGLRKSIAANRKAHWDAFKSLQKRANKAWSKLRTDVKRGANPNILIRDRNQLLLLLGECNYMTRECTRFAHPRARSARRR